MNNTLAEVQTEIEAWYSNHSSNRRCSTSVNVLRPDLKEKLDEAGKKDQLVRTGGTSSDMNYIDAENTELLMDIISEVGWPNECIVGVEAATSAFLILQHSTDATLREKGLTLFEEELKAGTVDGSQYAYLIDRELQEKGEPQIYGTQYRCDIDNGVFILWDIEDPDQVDHLREGLGLFPIYIQNKMMSQQSCGS